jgi:hypothetical protein
MERSHFFRDMKAFIGVIIKMGLVRLPNMKEYWNRKTLLFAVPGISQLFSLQRFIDVYSCLCLRDSSRDNSDNKISKIEPLVISIISQSQLHYNP